MESVYCIGNLRIDKKRLEFELLLFSLCLYPKKDQELYYCSKYYVKFCGMSSEKCVLDFIISCL